MRAVLCESQRSPIVSTVALLSLLPWYATQSTSYTPYNGRLHDFRSIHPRRQRRRRKRVRGRRGNPVQPMTAGEFENGAFFEGWIRKVVEMPSQLYRTALFALSVRRASMALSPFLDALKLMESHATDYFVTEDTMKAFVQAIRNRLSSINEEDTELVRDLQTDQHELLPSALKTKLAKLNFQPLKTATTAKPQKLRKGQLDRQARRVTPGFTTKYFWSRFDDMTKYQLSLCAQVAFKMYAQGQADVIALNNPLKSHPVSPTSPLGSTAFSPFSPLNQTNAASFNPKSNARPEILACAYASRRYFPNESALRLSEELQATRRIETALEETADLFRGALVLTENAQSVIREKSETLAKAKVPDEIQTWLWDCFLVLLRDAYKNNAELATTVWGDVPVSASFGTEPLDYAYLAAVAKAKRLRSGNGAFALAQLWMSKGQEGTGEGEETRKGDERLTETETATYRDREKLWAAQVEAIRRGREKLLNLPSGVASTFMAKQRQNRLDDVLKQMLARNQDLFMSRRKPEDDDNPVDTNVRVVRFNLVPQVYDE